MTQGPQRPRFLREDLKFDWCREDKVRSVATTPLANSNPGNITFKSANGEFSDHSRDCFEPTGRGLSICVHCFPLGSVEQETEDSILSTSGFDTGSNAVEPEMKIPFFDRKSPKNPNFSENCNEFDDFFDESEAGRKCSSTAGVFSAKFAASIKESCI
jgi:hypothetical protein